MKSSPKIKYLPFSPGIPWEVKGGIIAPKIDYDLLSEIIDKKKITIIAHGGALESFYSLAIIEMLNYNFPNSSLRWSGENCFFELVKLQGIVSDQADSSLKDLVKKYPAPIFLDKKRNVYFNSLNNYTSHYTTMKLCYKDM